MPEEIVVLEPVVVAPVVIEPVVAPVKPEPTPELLKSPAPAEQTMVPLSALEAERKKRQEAREKEAYWKGVAESRLQTPVAPAAVSPPPVEQKAPQAPARPARLKSDDFDTWPEYEAAQARLEDDYQAKRDEYITKKVKWDLLQEGKQQTQEQTRQQKVSTYLERLNKAAELDPELKSISDHWHEPGPYQLPLNDTIQEAILESEIGPEILRHLYNNKQDAARIARLGQVASVRELVKIEEAITNQSKTVPKRVSSAPPPITPVSPSGAIEIDDDKRPAADVIREMRIASARRR